MAIHFFILGGDARQRYLAEELCRQGHRVSTRQVPGTEDRGDPKTAEVVLLPTPTQDTAGRIRGTELTPKEAAKLLPAGVPVIGGKAEALRDIFPDIIDSARWETLALASAVPTAEGAIRLAMEALPQTIHGSRFLVVGAGRIGSCLAGKLKALNGRVTVTARRAADLVRLEGLGLDTAVTGRYECGLSEFSCVFGTVPAAVFTREQLDSLPRGCVLIDLASAPGSFTREACENAGLSYICGTALPGRLTPRSAGELLAREILRHLGETP